MFHPEGRVPTRSCPSTGLRPKPTENENAKSVAPPLLADGLARSVLATPPGRSRYRPDLPPVPHSVPPVRRNHLHARHRTSRQKQARSKRQRQVEGSPSWHWVRSATTTMQHITRCSKVLKGAEMAPSKERQMLENCWKHELPNIDRPWPLPTTIPIRSRQASRRSQPAFRPRCCNAISSLSPHRILTFLSKQQECHTLGQCAL